MQHRIFDNIGKQDVEHTITGQTIMVRKILHLSLILLPLVFCVVIFLIMSSLSVQAQTTEANQSQPQIEMLLLALLVVGFAVMAGGPKLKTMLLKPSLLLNKVKPYLESGEEGAEKKIVSILLAHQLITSVILLALSETLALFGLALIFYASTQGIDQHPIVWLALIPTLLHIMSAILTFPSRKSVVDTVYEQMIRPIARYQG